MSVPLPLYPNPTFPHGKTLNLFISLAIPTFETQIKIKQVDLKGDEILLLWQFQVINNDFFANCALSRFTTKVSVIVPSDINEEILKINHYVLGKTWNWNDPSDQDINFIKNEAEYRKNLFL